MSRRHIPEREDIRVKDYLSYSQFDMFMRSPDAYRKAYIFGYKFSNKYTEFGSEIHSALETREPLTEDGLIATEIVPRAQQREVGLTRKVGGVPLYVKIDGVYKSRCGWGIKEYKTSKNGWTQRRVDKAKQLTFYAAVLSRVKRVPISSVKISLDCLGTFEDEDGDLHLLGDRKVFFTKRTDKDIKELIPQIRYAWSGIGQLLREFART